MFKSLVAGAVAVGLIVAPITAGAMSTHKTHHKIHKVHHAKKMAPGTTTGMSSGKATDGAKSMGGYQSPGGTR